jgi:hypothetical protein
MTKPKLRARLAALGFSEKVKILEKLRDRSLAMAAAGLRSTRRGRGKVIEGKMVQKNIE